MSFEVKIEVFEGPFDLLLQLITRQELDIYRVPVAQITDSFIRHIEEAEQFDLDTATDFLLIAATLLLIKARSLLPSGEDEPEAGEPEGAREFLIERLVEYKTFSGAADWLTERYSQEGWYTPRLREIEADYAGLYPDPFEGADVSLLACTLLDLLVDRTGSTVDIGYIAPIRVSVAEYMDRVRQELYPGGSATFGRLVEKCTTKIELIATFLAVLELYKRGEILLSQRRLFGEIKLTARGNGESDVA